SGSSSPNTETSGTTTGSTGKYSPVGTACTSTSVVDKCAQGGLVCDGASGQCRLPYLGEQCQPSVGCADAPTGMGCYVANDNGTAVNLCLIPCSNSSVCPYGMSCLANGNSYCTSQASGDCMPG